MTALWNLDSENISAARKLPPMSTRNWSSQASHRLKMSTLDLTLGFD
jgi:hypothetical protein